MVMGDREAPSQCSRCSKKAACYYPVCEDCWDEADEAKRLREALERIANPHQYKSLDTHRVFQEIARKALDKE